MYRYIAKLILILCICFLRQSEGLFKIAKCEPSVATLIRNNPALSIWWPAVQPYGSKKLLPNAPDAIYEQNCPGLMPNGFTVLVTTSDSLKNLVSDIKINSSSLAKEWYDAIYALDGPLNVTSSLGLPCPSGNISYKGNSVALYDQLPQGIFTPDQLLQLKSVPSALSILQNNSFYDLKFYKDSQGKVCIGNVGTGIGGCIISADYGCDGALYTIDAFLIPTRFSNELPDEKRTMYAIPTSQLPAGNSTPCSRSVSDVLSSDPNLSIEWKLWQDLGYPYDNILKDPNSKITVIAVSNAGLQAALPQEYIKNLTSTKALDNATRTLLQASLMDQIIANPYCPRELLQANSVYSLWKEASNNTRPYAFSLNYTDDGDRELVGARDLSKTSKESLALVTSWFDGGPFHVNKTDLTCNGVVYTIDAYTGLLNATNGTNKIHQKELEKAYSAVYPAGVPFLKPITCDEFYNNTVAQNSNASLPPEEQQASSTDGSSSLSSGAIAGIAVGAVVAAVIMVMLASTYFRCSRRRVEHRGSFRGDKIPFSDDVYVYADQGGSSSENGMSTTRVLLRNESYDAEGKVHGWEIAPDCLQVDKDQDKKPIVLGRGGFGIVYLGTLNGVQKVAIKVVRDPGSEYTDAFIREISILQRVSRDRNIVQFTGIATTAEDSLMIVTEYMEGGDLRCALSGVHAGSMLWHNKGKSIALDIARGLAFLHSNKVIHRDLKTKNVLLNKDRTMAKIADVGAAVIHADGYLTPASGMIGTLAWAAPELLLGQRISDKVDMYSFGVVLWELATQQIPKRGFVDIPAPGPKCPPELSTIITECMSIDPKDRPTAKEAYDRLMACPPKL